MSATTKTNAAARTPATAVYWGARWGRLSTQVEIVERLDDVGVTMTPFIATRRKEEPILGAEGNPIGSREIMLFRSEVGWCGLRFASLRGPLRENPQWKEPDAVIFDLGRAMAEVRATPAQTNAWAGALFKEGRERWLAAFGYRAEVARREQRNLGNWGLPD